MPTPISTLRLSRFRGCWSVAIWADEANVREIEKVLYSFVMRPFAKHSSLLDAPLLSLDDLKCFLS